MADARNWKITEAEALVLAREAMRAAGLTEAEGPLAADGQSLPDFWLVLPAGPQAHRRHTAACVHAQTGDVELGGYQVTTIDEDL